MRVSLAGCVVALLTAGAPAAAQPAAQPAVPGPPDLFAVHPLSDVLENAGGSFADWNALYHVSGAMLTVMMAASGADARVQEAFQRYDPIGGQVVGDVVYVAGYVAPLATGAALWTVGLADADQELIGAGSAAIQAVGLTSIVVSAEKLLTGRRGPLQPDCSLRCNDPATRTSDGGDFAFVWTHDPFTSGRNMWPSGHTATAFALVSSLTAYYDEEAWVPAVGYPLATFIGVGMIEADHHWTSDVIAGALIGQAIGWTVGARFRERVDALRYGGSEPGPRPLFVAPVIGGGAVGIRVGGTL